MQRNVGYVDYQNRDYRPSQAAADYIWNMIDVVYGDYRCNLELNLFSKNSMVEIVDEIAALKLYVVKLEDGFGYIAMDGVSETAYSTAVYSGGGSGGEWALPQL